MTLALAQLVFDSVPYFVLQNPGIPQPKKLATTMLMMSMLDTMTITTVNTLTTKQVLYKGSNKEILSQKVEKVQKSANKVKLLDF